jgi:hypothetical protein
MLGWFKRLWSEATAHSTPADRARALVEQPTWPDEGPLLPFPSPELTTHYVLPLRWSLHYALTETQWRDLRKRHRQLYPNSELCSCPKRCKANTLDEAWRYDHAAHTKIFLGAEFICPGCHWFKTLPWRMRTWLEQRNGLLPPMSKPPHIIECLGWSQQQVDAMRDRDLIRHEAEAASLTELARQVQQGVAAIIPSPPERLSPQELERFVRPGQAMVVPWRVDLSGLERYGYSPGEIDRFVDRMYALAAKRMAGDQ